MCFHFRSIVSLNLLWITLLSPKKWKFFVFNVSVLLKTFKWSSKSSTLKRIPLQWKFLCSDQEETTVLLLQGMVFWRCIFFVANTKIMWIHIASRESRLYYVFDTCFCGFRNNFTHVFNCVCVCETHKKHVCVSKIMLVLFSDTAVFHEHGDSWIRASDCNYLSA